MLDERHREPEHAGRAAGSGGEMGPPPPLVLHARRGFNAGSALGCAVAVGASLWLLRSGAADALWKVVLIGFVIVFGAAALALAKRALDPRPALTVDGFGIRDRRAGVAAPWSEVEGVSTWRQQLRTTHVDWIVLDVRDPASVRDGVLARSRALGRIARAMGTPPVLLLTQDLAIGHDALLAELRRRHAVATGRPA